MTALAFHAVVAPPGGAEELGRNLGRAVGRTWRRINRPDP